MGSQSHWGQTGLVDQCCSGSSEGTGTATKWAKWVKRSRPSVTGVVLAAAPTAVMMTLVNFWEEGTEDGSPPRLVVGSVSEQGGKTWSPCWWVMKLVKVVAWCQVGREPLGWRGWDESWWPP